MRTLTRAQAAAGTLTVIVLGAGLVLLLGAIFGRAGDTRDDGFRAGFAFDEPGGGAGGIDTAAGAFRVVDGVLIVDEVPDGGAAVALIDRRADDGRLVVTAADPAPGWGVVVRWDGPADHWAVAVPAAGGPLELVRVEDGEATVVATTDAPLTAGAVVDVRYDRRRVDVRVDEGLVMSGRSEAVTGRQVGLQATAPGPTWDDLQIGPRPRPVVRPEG